MKQKMIPNEVGKIVLFQAECGLCGQKVTGITRDEARALLRIHIDRVCTIAKLMRELKEAGIYKEVVYIWRMEALEKKLKRLLKDYSADEIGQALELLESE